jgi:hypothetical protein
MLSRYFQKQLDTVLPMKEANPYIEDFKFLSQKRQMIRNFLRPCWIKS